MNSDVMSSKVQSREEIEQIIDNTIIRYLKQNNIFESIMSIEEIRDRLLKIVKSIEYKDLRQHGAKGYWHDGEIAVEKREDTVLGKATTIIVHELLHALSTREDEDRLAIGTFVKNEKCEYGDGLNEGITEYLTQRILEGIEEMYDNKKGVTFNIPGTYPMEQIIVKQLAILYGEDKIIRAYLHNHDIDMPQEQYEIILNSLDYINTKNSNKKEIQKGRKIRDLSIEEQLKIKEIDRRVSDAFERTQQFFLEHCLVDEINNISTVKQAEEMKAKLRELNSSQIKIEGNEKANYEKYNFMFIRRYLQIINKDKNLYEQVSFDDVEKYLASEAPGLFVLPDTPEYLEEHEKSLFKNVGKFFRKSFHQVMNNVMCLMKEEYVSVDRGDEGTIYLKEIGQDTIAGRRIFSYEYLTEEDYQKYMAGDLSIEGKILRGKIDFRKLKKDEEYRVNVGGKLLAQKRLDERLHTCNGYIGRLDEDGRIRIAREVEARLHEEEPQNQHLELSNEESRSWNISSTPITPKRIISRGNGNRPNSIDR